MTTSRRKREPQPSPSSSSASPPVSLPRAWSASPDSCSAHRSGRPSAWAPTPTVAPCSNGSNPTACAGPTAASSRSTSSCGPPASAPRSVTSPLCTCAARPGASSSTGTVEVRRRSQTPRAVGRLRAVGEHDRRQSCWSLGGEGSAARAAVCRRAHHQRLSTSSANPSMPSTRTRVPFSSRAQPVQTPNS